MNGWQFFDAHVGLYIFTVLAAVVIVVGGLGALANGSKS